MPKVPFKAPKTKTKTRKREKVMNFFKNIWQNRKSKKNIEKDADKPKFFKYCASPLESLSNEDYLNNPKKFKILMQRNDYKTFRQLVKNNNLNQIKPRSTGSWESSLFNPTVRPSLTKIGRQTISEKAASTGNKIILVDEAKKTQVFEFLEKYKPSKEAFKDAELGNISPLFSGSKSIQSLEKEVMSKEPKDNYVPLERRTNTLNKLVQNDKLDEESAAETTQSYNYNSNSKVDRVRVIDENLET
jgi:hypothetical protein